MRAPRIIAIGIVVVALGLIARAAWPGSGDLPMAAGPVRHAVEAPVPRASSAAGPVVGDAPAAARPAPAAEPIASAPDDSSSRHAPAPVAPSAAPVVAAAAQAVITPAAVAAKTTTTAVVPPTAARPAVGADDAAEDPAARMIAAVAAGGTPAGGPSGGPANLAPLPGGAGLVINDGRIPCGFTIDPREYAGGVLHIDNHSGTPAILTINDPAAAAACTIAGVPVEPGRPYQVDGLEITAAHPVTVFVQPGRAPGPPAGPGAPRSDG